MGHGRCGLPPAFGCPVRLSQLLVDHTEALQGIAFLVPVAGLPAQGESPPEVVAGPLVAAHPQVDVAECALLQPEAAQPVFRQPGQGPERGVLIFGRGILSPDGQQQERLH